MAAPRLRRRWSVGLVAVCAVILVVLASFRIKADNVELAALVWLTVMFGYGTRCLDGSRGEAGHLCVVVLCPL